MAPALTEPVSSSEKTSNSTANIKELTSVVKLTADCTVHQSELKQRVRNSKFQICLNNNNNNNNNKINKNEQMGLSDTVITNNSSNINSHNNNEITIPSESSELREYQKSGIEISEQLLADAKINFEETANNLRKYSLNLFEESTNKDRLLIQPDSGGVAEFNSLKSMESMEKAFLNEDCIEQKKEQDTVISDQKQGEELSKCSKAEDKLNTTNSELSTRITTTGSKQQPELSGKLRPQIISVEELPAISTDSTMTASEVEDNIEERLSQLDGTAIVSSTTCDAHVTLNMNTINIPQSSTSPRTVQLQQTPTASLSQHIQSPIVQQTLLTPQSTTFIKESNSAGELEDQDIEEVLKALKGFDGTSGADALCDLNVLFNEVYTTLNYEEISSQPASIQTKPNPLKELQVEIEKNQQSMQRKIDFLLRRMRKVQSRYMSKHTSEEVAGLFEWSARIACKGGMRTAQVMEKGGNLMKNPSSLLTIADRPPALNWSEEKKNPVSSAQMSIMLRKLNKVANVQQLCTSTPVSISNSAHALKKSKKAVQDVLAALSTMNNERKSEILVSTLDDQVAEELIHVVGLLQSEMREVQNAIDSDATESSSGGESADEMVTYNNASQKSLSIASRAAWKYSRDRAAIASRWSWLLSQISDLEIKLRQHTELHQEIVRTKGTVTYDIVGSRTSKSLGGVSSTHSSSVNGYRDDINVTLVMGVPTDNTIKDENESDSLPGSCRTRGYIASLFRKRKLLQTTNIHTISKKAARPSTIKCGCYWPLHPCALCTGRSDPTAPRDLPDTMMMPERIALLDSGFHPVLSFPEDVSNSIHFEAIARQPEWQQRVIRCQVKSIAKSVWKAEREATAFSSGGQNTSKRHGSGGDSNTMTTKRRYTKKKDRSVAEDSGKSASAEVAVSNSNPSTSGGTFGKTITAANDAGGNGIGTLSTSTTTPLVANKLTKNSKKLHCHLVGDGVLLEPLPPQGVAANHSQPSSNSSTHQTSGYPLRNYDQSNHNQAHLSLTSNNPNICSKNNKYNRKLSTTSATNTFHNHHTTLSQHYHHYNNSHYLNSLSNDSNTEANFLHTNDNWVDSGLAARSRTSSPTHGTTNNSYHKYERSLDRKNRSSYDIDNIVIPYSVAATTRVEILPYKEIPTPKWRIIEIDNEKSNMHNSSVESIKLEEPSAVDHYPNINGGIEAERTSETLKKDKIDQDEKCTFSKVGVLEEIDNKNVNNEIGRSDVLVVNRHEHTIHEDINNMETTKTNTTMIKVLAADEIPMVVTNEKHENDEPVEMRRRGIKRTTDSNDTVDESMAKKSKMECTFTNDAVTSLETNTTTTTCTTNSNTEGRKINSPKAIGTAAAAAAALHEDDIEENISDEAMVLRHERALTEERRKFQTFLKFPWSTRSRANRRIDSRAESSGANTPDPASPAPQSLGGGDQESIPSPLALSATLTPVDSAAESSETIVHQPPIYGVTPSSSSTTSISNCISNKRHERRRTISMKKEQRDMTVERRCSTPDPKELIPPFEPLNFPLSDEIFESLLQDMPNDYQNDSIYDESGTNTSINKAPIHNHNNNNRSSLNHETFGVKRIYKSAINNTERHTFNHKGKQRNGKHGFNGMRFGDHGGISSSHRPISGAKSKNTTNTGGVFDSNVNDNDDDDDDDGGDGVDEEEKVFNTHEDDVEKDYPKHHLVPNDNYMYDHGGHHSGIVDDGVRKGNGAVTNVKSRIFDDDEYNAYVGGGYSVLDASECGSSDAEPFQDDDPNDPEWKGQSEDRCERILRKKV